MVEKIDAKLFRRMILSALNQLERDKKLIDKLNVFPVPDGDTGTNMFLTLDAAVKEVNMVVENDLSKLSGALTKGSLMGARGNSGVILSQIIRGFSAAVEGQSEWGVQDMIHALENSKKVAYKAVMKPVEGTMLTVVRETAEFAKKNKNKFKSLDLFLEAIHQQAASSLKNTPNLLKALKDANVVDSGGRGLLSILEGALSAYQGNPVDRMSQQDAEAIDYEEFVENEIHIFDGDLEFKYCTEFILMTDLVSEDEFKREIEPLGDSMVVVGAESLIKVHLHTNDPGVALEKATKYGNVDRIKIENMEIQYQNRLSEQSSNADVACDKLFSIITTTVGEGFYKLMKDLRVDQIVEGGQTMNPSTQDFLSAVELSKQDDILILPNNKNVILAATQAASLSNKNVKVLETKDIPQAICALLALDPDRSLDENFITMKEAIEHVKTGSVTYAVRDTNTERFQIKEGDMIGLSLKEILAVGSSVDEVCFKLLEELIDEESELVTLYFGENMTQEEAERIRDEIEERYPEMDFEIYNGGQPIYHFFVSVE